MPNGKRFAAVCGASKKFMSDRPNSARFIAQRRGGAEKESEEPHIVPNPIRLNFGMGDEISILFSAPLRLCASAGK